MCNVECVDYSPALSKTVRSKCARALPGRQMPCSPAASCYQGAPSRSIRGCNWWTGDPCFHCCQGSDDQRRTGALGPRITRAILTRRRELRIVDYRAAAQGPAYYRGIRITYSRHGPDKYDLPPVKPPLNLNPRERHASKVAVCVYRVCNVRVSGAGVVWSHSKRHQVDG